MSYIPMDEDLLWDLHNTQSRFYYWRKKYPFFVAIFDDIEEERWFDFARACYALESGI